MGRGAGLGDLGADGMKRALTTIRDVMRNGDPRVAALASIVAAAWWSAGLAWPDATFSRKSYGWMRDIMPEPSWAATFGLLAAAQLWALGRPTPASWCALAAAILWTYTSFSWAVHNFPPPSAAMGGHVAVAALSWWEWVRRDGR